MSFFLNEERRNELVAKLTELSMPKTMAQMFASFENITQVDVAMAASVRQSNEYVSRLSTCQDNDERNLLITFLNAGITIRKSYKEEMKTRGMTENDTPLWREAAKDGIPFLQNLKDRREQSTVH